MPDTNWTAIGEPTSQEYTDTAVFRMSADTKAIEKITGQALVAGEENSQYIRFLLPRYWDGIDISEKTLRIEYLLAGQYYGASDAVNTEMSDEQVRFGWIVPGTACAIPGTLLFILRIDSEDYILKSQIAEHPVQRTINFDDIIPEPTRETWYREFEARIANAIDNAEVAVSEAQSALPAVQEAVQSAQSSAEIAQGAQSDAEAAATTATEASEMATTAAGEAQESAQTAETAKEDSLTAQNAAETAKDDAEQALADTRAAIAADSATTALPITRVISTTYMTDAQFARVAAWKKHRMLFLKFNAEFTSAGLDATSGFVTIATISGWSALDETFVSIPKQTDGSKVMTLFVRSNGEVQVHSPQAAISGWFRGYICVPYSG